MRDAVTILALFSYESAALNSILSNTKNLQPDKSIFATFTFAGCKTFFAVVALVNVTVFVADAPVIFWGKTNSSFNSLSGKAIFIVVGPLTPEHSNILNASLKLANCLFAGTPERFPIE